MPGRAIDGEFIQNVEKGQEAPKNCAFHCIKTCDYTKSPYCIVQALYQAARGNMKKGYAFTGINVHLSQKISSVKEVISKLKAEFLNATRGNELLNQP
jgi:NAD(P)H-dependent flavin oxidoreductase YrpB (nitropropane dioxygenase family)